MAADGFKNFLGTVMRIVSVVLAFVLAGCETLPSTITDAQMNVLKAQIKEEMQASKDLDSFTKVIKDVADNGDSTVKVVSLMILNQTFSAATQARAMRQPANNDGPITSFFKAAAPYVIPGLQIWAADRSGERNNKLAFGNMNLIQGIAGQIQRDPLVVNNPAPQVVQLPGAPAPQVIQPQIVQIPGQPIMIPPFVVEQPIIVPAP